jgi:hypothetical protein
VKELVFRKVYYTTTFINVDIKNIDVLSYFANEIEIKAQSGYY